MIRVTIIADKELKKPYLFEPYDDGEYIVVFTKDEDISKVVEDILSAFDISKNDLKNLEEDYEEYNYFCCNFEKDGVNITIDID